MSFISTLYNFTVNLSPYSEIFFRKLYWKHVKILKKFKPRELDKSKKVTIDFEKIINYIKECGVNQDDILIVHSSFNSMAGNNLTPESIIDELLEIIPAGTLAMPAIRRFDEDCEYDDYIQTEDYEITANYDVWNSKIISGILPFVLMRYDNAVASRCPLNPLVAVGNEAAKMMENNIESGYITAHGVGSCWEYCANRDAWNIGLGIDIKGFLTIHHVFQELSGWPVKNWFFKRNFLVIDGKFRKDIIVNERRHLWTQYLAENHFYNDLINAGIIKTKVIDGVNVFACKTSELESFIKTNTRKTYPYYIPKSMYHEY